MPSPEHAMPPGPDHRMVTAADIPGAESAGVHNAPTQPVQRQDTRPYPPQGATERFVSPLDAARAEMDKAGIKAGYEVWVQRANGDIEAGWVVGEPDDTDLRRVNVSRRQTAPDGMTYEDTKEVDYRTLAELQPEIPEDTIFDGSELPGRLNGQPLRGNWRVALQTGARVRLTDRPVGDGEHAHTYVNFSAAQLDAVLRARHTDTPATPPEEAQG